MLILGIDTSCDDTSAAVVKDGTVILSNVVSSQAEIHKRYGGIVPELASRRHTENIIPVVEEALRGAGTTFKGIDAIAVCFGPGLIGSLLIGCCFVKSLAYALNRPVVTVNHLEGHIYSAFLSDISPQFPFLSLVVSGGHTSLFCIEGHGIYKELGKTRDDAAGEAYDKFSKMLGLGYPGGPIIDKLAREGNKDAFKLPKPLLPDCLDFSFSGLKTYVKNTVNKLKAGNELTDTTVRDLAASFQTVIVEVLVTKLLWAVKDTGVCRVSLSGGVAANDELRNRLLEVQRTDGLEVFLPPKALCTDNGAMIAAAAYQRFIKGEVAGLDFNPRAYMPLTQV